jgi:hypothetical protein
MMTCNTMRVRGAATLDRFRMLVLMDSIDVREAIHGTDVDPWYMENTEEMLIDRNTYQAMIEELIY